VAEERRRHDSYAIGAAVRLGAGRDNDGIHQVISDLLAQPAEMDDVLVGGDGVQLDLHRDHASVATLDDQVDLALAGVRAQVADGGCRPTDRPIDFRLSKSR
jgi:hypothetical protein